MLFFALIVAPFLQTISNPHERSNIYHTVGKKFRLWGWVAISLLLITGWLNIYLMGVPLTAIFNPAFYNSSFGMALGVKLSMVFLIVITSFLHDFIYGPKAGSEQRYSIIARWFGRVNLLIALVIVFLAVSLRLGGL